MQLQKIGMLVVALALGIVAQSASAETIVLKFHHFLPASSNAHQNLIVPWCDKIAKESNGRLKCQIYPSMQLGGTPPQLFDQVRDGVADLVWTLPTYQAGRFTKSEVFELPFMVKTAEKGSPAFWEYVQKHSLDEFKGTKLILVHLHDGAVLHFRDKPVKTMEDMKGLKVRAPTRIASKLLEALGAVPVQMPAPQVPDAIAKGVVDGVMFPWEVVTSLKIQEVVKYHVDTAPGLPKMSNSIFVIAMNQAKYDSLPPDLRKVIDDNSGLEMSRWAGKVFDGPQVTAKKIAHDRGNTFITLTNKEYRRWEKVADGVDAEWFKEVGAKGADGKKLLEDARALIKKYDR